MHAPNQLAAPHMTAGANDGTRKAASQQICEIAQAHPAQIASIIRKVGVGCAGPTRSCPLQSL
jgi:hypothetical protein